MRATFCAAIMLLSMPWAAMAQDAGNSQDWKKMYEDASAQLRAAQDRKSHLANDNTELTAKVADLEKSIHIAQTELDALRLQIESFAEERSQFEYFYDAWEAFVHGHPDISHQWSVAYGAPLWGGADNGLVLYDPHWPFAVP